MRRLFDEMFLRPLGALLSGAELLGRRVGGTQMIDGVVSRVVHALSGTRAGGEAPREPPPQTHRARDRDGIPGRRPLE
jgi:hypothetical protein